MKILFNNNILSNSQKISHKGTKDFQFDPFKTSNYDVFLRSPDNDGSKIEEDVPIEDQIFDACFGDVKDLIPENYKYFWKLNYALAFYFENFQEMGIKALKTGMPLEIINEAFIDFAYGEKIAQGVRKYLTKAKLIDNEDGLKKISSAYNTISKRYPHYLDTRGLFYLSAYTSLENKDDILNFPYILIEASEQDTQQEKNYDLNKIAAFIKSLGIKNENAFFEKFSHLSKNFNNLKDPEDKFDAFLSVYNSFSQKEEKLKKLIKENPKLKDATPNELYSKYFEIIEYLYKENEQNWTKELNEILSQIYGQEDFTKDAQKVIKPMSDLSTAKGKIEFLELINYEGLTIAEINRLASVRTLYTTIGELSFIFNKNAIVANLTTLDDFDEESANEFYQNFKQTLNAIYDENSPKQEADLQTFRKILKTFNLKNDDEFFNFYRSLTQKPSKQSKKPQTYKKATPEEIKNFIYLFNFISDDNLQKYKKDKNYPLVAELKKKKENFEKVKTTIEEELAKKGAIVQKNTAIKAYCKYSELLKKYPYIPVFVEKILAQGTDDFIEIDIEKELRAKFSKYFQNEQMLNAFLAKNDIEISSSKEDMGFCEIYLEILGLILDGKKDKEQEKYYQKILNSDFFKNSKSGIINFVKRKNKEDLKIIFEIILDEKISSIEEINKILNKYSNKDKEISAFLGYYKAQNLGFKDFIRKIEQLQKELENSNIDIKINNDNIHLINLDDYNDGKIGDFKLAQLAKKLLNVQDDYNFLYGLRNTFIDEKEQPIISPNTVAREIMRSIGGTYDNEYKNLIRCLGIKKELNSKTSMGYIESLIPKELIDVLNSKEIFDFRQNPSNALNISYHAKLRLLERFILEGHDMEYLNTQEAKDEIKEVLRTIYTKTPVKIYKGSTKEENSFVTISEYKDGAIKTIFNVNGDMGSIVKI